MRIVYNMTYKKEILDEKVDNSEKIFSIFEDHVDIISKGNREIKFGHKVNLATGRSNLILDCEILVGNPSDTKLLLPTIDRINENYDIIPRDCCTDGGYASSENSHGAKERGISNIVFNKIRGSMQNHCSSKKMETMLKKWRSGVEAVISNLKRGFNIFKCNWKGRSHFDAKVLWSAIGYNIRVITSLMLEKMKVVQIQ